MPGDGELRMTVNGRRPRIGLTTDPSYPVGEYEAAIRAAGGEPVVLMPASGADLMALDGIVFSGGEDVDPARYGQPPHARTEIAARERDAFEADLMRDAMQRGLPTLAICRGVQVANVAFGGTLHQHVPDTFGDAVPHQPQAGGATFRGVIDAHRVAIEPASRLAVLTGVSIATGSRHHQALDRVAAPFHVVARTPDGVIEAIEPDAACPFWLGVQWHPESTVALDGGASAALFSGLVEASRSERGT
jgi:putative glutamine amidotransferase